MKICWLRIFNFFNLARYLARKFKLAGKTDDDEQQAEVDSYVTIHLEINECLHF